MRTIALPALPWKRIVGLLAIVLAVVLLILGRFSLFEALVIGLLGVFLV